MEKFNRIVALTIIVGVLQLCTANPVAVEAENDVTKLFTAEELQNARNAGIKDRELITRRSIGVTVDEMIKLCLLKENEPNGTRSITFEEMTKVCEIFVPQHKTATNYSSDQEIRLNKLNDFADRLPQNIQFLYLRNSICAYVSDPFKHEMDASSFVLKLVPYMHLRFWKLKNVNATGVERVNAANEICCIYKGHPKISDIKFESTSFGLSEDKITDFVKHWNE